MKKQTLKQILGGGIVSLGLLFSGGCGAVLVYGMMEATGANRYYAAVEQAEAREAKREYEESKSISSAHTSIPQEAYTTQKETNNQESVKNSLTTGRVFERKGPALEIGSLAYSTNSEFNEFFNYQYKLNALEAEISKLTDSEKIKLNSMKFESLEELETYLDTLKKEVIDPSLRIEKEYRGTESKQSPLIRQLNRRADGVRK